MKCWVIFGGVCAAIFQQARKALRGLAKMSITTL